MNKKELIAEYASIFNTMSSFIETNKRKVTGKKLVPTKSRQKINGFIASIFDEYGTKDGLIVLDLFSTSLEASLCKRGLSPFSPKETLNHTYFLINRDCPH
jgi:hypothetical protein